VAAIDGLAFWLSNPFGRLDFGVVRRHVSQTTSEPV